MAGSIKWFIYTDDAGSDWAIKRDESNTEAVNGSTQDLIDGANVPNAVPRNIVPRYVVYSNAARTRTIKVTVLTSAIFSGVINGGVPTIADPIAGTGTLGLVSIVGEKRNFPIPLDTGLDDGDAT